MKLRDGLWLEGAYYIDIDQLNQLRVVGPDNHLHFGMVGLYHPDITVSSVRLLRDGSVSISIATSFKQFFLHDPAMGHMRKVRRYTEFDNKPTPTFFEVAKKHPTELEPNYLHVVDDEVTYRRLYGEHWYGVRLQFDTEVTVQRSVKKRGFELKSQAPITLTLIAETDRPIKPALSKVVSDSSLDFSLIPNSSKIERMWERAGVEVTHLVQYNKTSGYEYGTVFPRDWMEAADLAGGDLTPAAVRYMYQQSMQHVDDTGSGWHENIVGEYDHEESTGLSSIESSLDELVAQANAARDRLKALVGQVRRLYINRNMIDIEPRYMMGLDRIMEGDPSESEMQQLKKTASYLVEQATDNQLITFKRLPDFFRRHRHDEEYFKAGNWRDSDNAFKLVHPVLAPYDVNAVFYPQALIMMRKHAGVLGLDAALLDALIIKWKQVKEWYRFNNTDGTSAYALALYDIHSSGDRIRYRKLKVNHTDEAYELFYGSPSETDVVSFCQRLIRPEYFFTQSGPTIVAADSGYTTEDYHGQVIWTKQTAYVVGGLARQLEIGKNEAWAHDSIDLITLALERTAAVSIKAFLSLQTIPELHYDHNGTPRFYNDQPMANGPMNAVQLWSAVGARRIIQEYIKVVRNG